MYESRHFALWVTIASVVILTAAMTSKLFPASSSNEFSHDFGNVLSAQVNQLSHKFTFTNQTATPLSVRQFSKGCTCTDASISRMLIPPGETALISMSTDVPTSHQLNERYCIVETDHPSYKNMVYRLSFTSLPPATFEPSYLAIADDDFIRDRALSVAEHVRLSIFDSGKPSSNRLFQISNTATARIESSTLVSREHLPGDVYQTDYILSLTIDGEARATYSGSTLNVAITYADGVATLPIIFRKTDKFTVHPSMVSFGHVTGDSGVITKNIFVTSNINSNLEDLRVESDSDYVEAKFLPSAIDPRPRIIQLTLDLTSMLAPGSAQTRSGTIKVVAFDGTLVRIPWSGFISSR